MLNRILENVKNMPSEFRAAPFWAWNTKLSPEDTTYIGLSGKRSRI